MRFLKWSAPILLFLLLVQWVALPLWWQTNLKRALYEWQEGPPVQMTLSCAQLEQCRLGKRELRIGGAFYDIREITVQGDSARIQAQRDYREERLWATAEGSGIHHLPGTGHTPEIATFFEVFLVPEGLPLYRNWRIDPSQRIVFFHHPLKANFGETPFPPPKSMPFHAYLPRSTWFSCAKYVSTRFIS